MAQKFVGIVLPIRRGNTGMFEQSTSAYEQARSNFKNLILTRKGERLSQPDLGCDLWKLVFEPITPETIDRARLSIVEAVDRWLPYLEVQDFKIQESSNLNGLTITCTYRFRNNPNVGDVVNIFADTETGRLDVTTR